MAKTVSDRTSLELPSGKIKINDWIFENNRNGGLDNSPCKIFGQGMAVTILELVNDISEPIFKIYGDTNPLDTLNKYRVKYNTFSDFSVEGSKSGLNRWAADVFDIRKADRCHLINIHIVNINGHAVKAGNYWDSDWRNC